MSDKIKPALTPEEWWKLSPTWHQENEFGGDRYLTHEQRLGLAAKCLHGLPFGFTHEDVDLLRTVAENCADAIWSFAAKDGEGRLRALADRIEALLPPREP